jgi:hypothetical protein
MLYCKEAMHAVTQMPYKSEYNANLGFSNEKIWEKTFSFGKVGYII